MRLSDAPSAYSQRDQQNLRNDLKAADDMNLKSDRHVQLRKGLRIEMYDDNGVRYAITVNTSGALVVTAL